MRALILAFLISMSIGSSIANDDVSIIVKGSSQYTPLFYHTINTYEYSLKLILSEKRGELICTMEVVDGKDGLWTGVLSIYSDDGSFTEERVIPDAEYEVKSECDQLMSFVRNKTKDGGTVSIAVKAGVIESAASASTIERSEH